MNLIDQVNRVVLAAANTPEEAINFFLKLMIEGAKEVASYRPHHKEARVFPIKNRVVQNRKRMADLFIGQYDTFVYKMTLRWVDLAKKWNSPKSIDMLKLLYERISAFKEELVKAFDEIKIAALDHVENITFVLDSYDLSKSQINLLKNTQKKLIEISKITYDKFILEIKTETINK